MLKPALLTAALVALAACAAPASTQTPDAPPMDRLAERYVRLVLALGQHDDGYVDAYYGPPAWRTEVAAEKRPLDAITADAGAVIAALQALPAPADALLQLRRQYLVRQLQALVAHAAALQGRRLGFDAEARALYDIDPLAFDAAALDAQLAKIDRLLPGPEPLAARYNAYVERFAIPPERLDAVMRAAIAEARRVSAEHIALPPGETFELAFVRDKPWSAYNWYQGGYRSRIEINTELPVTVARAIELAVHEGYPGHHVYNSLLEQALVDGRSWVEYSVYALYSPQSLIAEGSADYGIALAFPHAQRVAFVRDTLFPLAGFDAAEAERYLTVSEAGRATGQATIEAARRYLDGVADAETTVRFLQTRALYSEARARQRIRFFDSYRAYIVNYTLGETLVADYVERVAGADVPRRWAVFAELLSSPRLPSGLRKP
ncbi:MAG: hypothetical protein ACLGI7_07815 [Gammaproteobacteria bacterium]